MRKAIKFRVAFLLSAISCYLLGFQLLPDSFILETASNSDLSVMTGFCLLYFIFLPVLYWFWVIKAGQQKPWKLIVIISLSCAMARFSFPAEIASYFEFIAWLRYPIIAVFLVLEIFVMASIVKGLWQARNAKGDPRVTLLLEEKNKQQTESDEPSTDADVAPLKSRKSQLVSELSESKAQAKLSLGLTLASEPACWYYAVPYLSRKHVKSEVKLTLMTGQRWHWLAMAVSTIVFSVVSYLGLYDWSELAAVIVASILFYSLIFVTANHRLSRHYSLYIHRDNLVINNSFWGLILVPLAQISAYKQGEWHRKGDNPSNKEQLQLGRGDAANIEIMFDAPLTYHGAMGQLPEPFSQVRLVVDKPEILMAMLDAYLQEQLIVTADENSGESMAEADNLLVVGE